MTPKTILGKLAPAGRLIIAPMSVLPAIASAALCFAAISLGFPTASRADTVASLLGNFTINQYCGVKLSDESVTVHYVVVYGQLPALSELHQADADGNGVTSQTERDDYVGRLAPGFAERLTLRIDGLELPLHAVQWTSSLPTEQGGFSLRVDVDLTATLPASAASATSKHALEFANQNYAGRLGWHEIVVEIPSGMSVFDTNAYGSSLTGGLTEALQSLPESGPLDERNIHLRFQRGPAPPGANLLGGRSARDVAVVKAAANKSTAKDSLDSAWIGQQTLRLVDAISGPRIEPRIALLSLLGAILLGAVHALSPGHGKTIVGAYLIGSRGTPRHAAFLGLTVTVTHTLGVFILGFATLYASRFIVPERLFPILSLISAVLVLGMGFFLLVQRVRAARQAQFVFASEQPFHPVAVGAASAGTSRGLIFAASATRDGKMHSHGGGRMHSHLPPGAAGEQITWRSLLALGISGGLVPCPSAMVLLLAAVALNKTAYGMLLVVAFSLGLAVTLTVIGMAFLYARNRFPRPRAGARWPQLLPVLSAATITILGIGLCFAALRSFGT